MSDEKKAESTVNDSIDVVIRTLELSHTIVEAIEHFISLLSGGMPEEGQAMLSIIGGGMESIENTFPVIFKEDLVEADVYDECARYFSEAVSEFEDIVNAVVSEDPEELKGKGPSLLAAYRKWDDAANKYLRKITLM